MSDFASKSSDSVHRNVIHIEDARMPVASRAERVVSYAFDKSTHLHHGPIPFSITIPGPREFANPAPLGLFSFATVTLVASLMDVHARGVTISNAILGMALCVGGLTQFIAGMWEFARGNTFNATAFSSFGGFWFARATMLIPGSGIRAAYEGHPEMMQQANAFFLTAWTIFNFFILIATFRASVGLIVLFSCLLMTNIFATVASYTGNGDFGVVSGWFGLATAFVAYYKGAANLLTRETSYFVLPVGKFSDEEKSV